MTMVGRVFAFVGSLNRDAPYFQGARGKGITVLDFDEASGRLTPLSERDGIDNPTFLAVHPDNRWVYATSEVLGWNEGTVNAYRFDPQTGLLTYLNKQPTLGSIAAHCSFDRTGRFLFVANYAIGDPAELPGQSVAVLPIREDGSLGAPVCSRAHRGTGPNSVRQERPHAHCVLASPDNRFVVVSDLGIDKLVVYRFDAGTGQLASAEPPHLDLAPGAGPRHFVFHPSGRLAYCVNELDSTIAALGFEAATGRFVILQTVPSLPAGFHEES